MATRLMAVSAPSRTYVPTPVPPNLRAHSASGTPGRLLLQDLPHLPVLGGGPHRSVWDHPPWNSFLSCFWKVSSAQSRPRPGHRGSVPARTSTPRVSVPAALPFPSGLPGPRSFPPPPAWLPSGALPAGHGSADRPGVAAACAGCLASRGRLEAPRRPGAGLSTFVPSQS